MIDTTGPDDLTPQERDTALAAEYVLGVLPPDEWQAARLRSQTDGAFAALVRDWEAQFSTLDAGFAPVEPPEAAFTQIENRLFGAPPARRRGLGFVLAGWRGWAMGGVLAAGVALAVMLVPAGPDPLIARLEADQITFEAVYDGEALQIARLGPPAGAGRDYELWAIGDDGVPRSLGLLRGAESRLNAAVLGAGITLAVSMEPEGGSPGDGPTGPVLAAAVLAARG